jgi:molybdenum cofactor guanylyltransferase
MGQVTVLILAGGSSSRMGRDKAWLDLDGMPLVERVARRLLPIAGEVIFSANDAGPFREVIAGLPVPAAVVADVYVAAGPLAGLHAGLAAARYEAVVAVATDMPFVDHRVIERMMALCGEADAVVPRILVEGSGEPQPEPLHAIYRRSCLPAIEAALSKGRRRMTSFLGDVSACYVDEEALRIVDPGLASFRNVNTPEEWNAIRSS